MPMSDHEAKMYALQHQLRENQVEMQDYLKDMENWQKEVSRKEKTLKGSTDPGLTSSRVLPPVRNSHRRKKKRKVKETSTAKVGPTSNRIRSYDYAAWDKYDADKVCEELSEDKSESSSESVTDEELEELQQKQQALVEKDKGNEYFKKGEYMLAIDHYSRGIQCDPTNPLLAANRAMALLKQNKFAAAEEDCTSCVKLDPTYIKGYLRRATARAGLHRYREAIEDYQQVLKLEPGNKLALNEVDKLHKKMEVPENGDIDESGRDGVVPDGETFKDVYKPPSQRSKKPLRRIEISEVGVEATPSHDQLSAKVEQSRSEAQQKQIHKDKQSFQQYTDPSKVAATTTTTTPPPPSLTTEPKPKPNLNPKPVSEEVGSDDSSSRENSGTNMSDEMKLAKESKVPLGQTLAGRGKSGGSSGGGGVSCGGVGVGGGGGGDASEESTDFKPDLKKFQYNWPHVKKDSSKIRHYLKIMDPEQYPSLVNEFIDSEMVTLLCANLPHTFPHNGDIILQHLTHLTRVKRFQMAAMFLSATEKQVIKDLLNVLTQQLGCDAAEVHRIGKLYGIR